MRFHAPHVLHCFIHRVLAHSRGPLPPRYRIRWGHIQRRFTPVAAISPFAVCAHTRDAHDAVDAGASRLRTRLPFVMRTCTPSGHHVLSFACGMPCVVLNFGTFACHGYYLRSAGRLFTPPPTRFNVPPATCGSSRSAFPPQHIPAFLPARAPFLSASRGIVCRPRCTAPAETRTTSLRVWRTPPAPHLDSADTHAATAPIGRLRFGRLVPPVCWNAHHQVLRITPRSASAAA